VSTSVTKGFKVFAAVEKAFFKVSKEPAMILMVPGGNPALTISLAI
jgi:hypothetical protein